MSAVSATNMERLLLSGEYSDFEIRCDGAVFPVHKSILGPNSDYFKTLFQSEFLENNQNLVEFEDEPEAVATLLLFIYVGHYASDRTELFFRYMDTVRANGTHDLSPGTNNHAEDQDKATENTFKPGLDDVQRHILTYAVADRIGTDKVRFEAEQWFHRLSGQTLVNDSKFAEHLALVYENTMANDQGLRWWFNRQCIEHDGNIGNVSSVVAKHDYNVWQAGYYYKCRWTLEKERSVKDKLASEKLNADLTSAKAQLQSDLTNCEVARETLSEDLGTLRPKVEALEEECANLARQLRVCSKNRRKQVRKLTSALDAMRGAARDGRYLVAEQDG